jgi:RNA polymerase sigma-70 factor (ECF subfamily)
MSCQSGGVQWAELEKRLRPFVQKRVVREADTDDVLQDVLLRVHRGVGSLRDEERFDGWIHRVARHAIADHLRAHAKHPIRSATELPEALNEPSDEDDLEVARDLSQCVSGFVGMLPSPYRESITLTELEGRSQKEAAELLGVSITAMKSRVQRGRAKLRELFEECCEIELDARGRVVDYTPRRC